MNSQFQEALTHCYQLIVRSENQQQLFDGICTVLTELDSIETAWIGLFDQQHKQITTSAVSGLGVNYLNRNNGVFSLEQEFPFKTVISALGKLQSPFCLEIKVPQYAENDQDTLLKWQSLNAWGVQQDSQLIAVLTLFSSNKNGQDEFYESLAELVRHINFRLGQFALPTISTCKAADKVNAASADQTQVPIITTLLNRVNDGIVALDSNWRYTYLNEPAVKMLQREKQEDLLGKHIWTEFPDGIGQPFHLAYLEAFDTQKSIVFEQHYAPWDLWFENRIYPSPDGVTIYFTEITARKRAEIELTQSSVLFASTRDGILVMDKQGDIVRINPTYSQISGFSQADVQGNNYKKHLLGHENNEFIKKFEDRLMKQGYWKGELARYRKNGELYTHWMTFSTVHDEQGEVSGYVAAISDISEKKQNEAELERLAHYDALTGLPNRLLLFLQLKHAIDSARRNQTKLALLMLDLDHFKDVNDSFGHFAGDELLKQVAVRLTRRFREVDTISRLGGDEFTILLENLTDSWDAAPIANEIIKLLSQPWHLSNGAEVHIGASVGITLYPQHGETAEELLQQADTSLYQAKSEGRGRFKYFSQELTEALRSRIEMERRLLLGIKNKELTVYYQPRIQTDNGQIVGAEALIRWLDPEKGMISPGEFIPVAESTGLINWIGDFVLEKTCSQGCVWNAKGYDYLKLAVNISAHQFLHSNIVDVVSKILKKTGFPAHQLELELTETALMDREVDAIKIFQQLRKLGVTIAIDDFGTGYSSLSYLKRFPLDILKVDKSFIDDIPHNQDDMAITKTIIAMGRTLGLHVLAEGVETELQLEYLKQQDCELYQGFLFSPAVDAEKFEQLLSSNH